jgi:hypothetical protein
MTTTKEQVVAAINVLCTVADTIRDLKQVPSGHLYTMLMTTGMEFDTYIKIIQVLKNAGLVKEVNHLLIWIGPFPENN